MPVVLGGYKELISALNRFDPDLNKEMKKEIKAAMLPIRDKARGYAPSPHPSYLYNWDKTLRSGKSTRGGRFPLYDANEVKNGIIYKAGANKKNRYGFSALYYVANTSAAGSIYETAGRTSGYRGRPTNHQITVGKRWGGREVTVKSTKDSQSRNPNAGAIFINSMGPMYGKDKQKGRLIFRAWNEDQGKAHSAVVRAIENATAKFNATHTKSSFALAA